MMNAFDLAVLLGAVALGAWAVRAYSAIRKVQLTKAQRALSAFFRRAEKLVGDPTLPEQFATDLMVMGRLSTSPLAAIALTVASKRPASNSETEFDRIWASLSLPQQQELRSAFLSFVETVAMSRAWLGAPLRKFLKGLDEDGDGCDDEVVLVIEDFVEQSVLRHRFATAA